MAPSVTLHLKGHCIETAAKRELKRLMDACFDGEGDISALEQSLELLTEFLSTRDFKALRSSDSRLDGTIESTVHLTRGPAGDPVIKIV